LPLADKAWLLYPKTPENIFQKISLPPCFFAQGDYYISAAKFSLSTCTKGYGETASWPHPTEGRVALQAGLHGHLLWHEQKPAADPRFSKVWLGADCRKRR
ncbi:MAG: hypothetical protein MUP25_04725, partial [Syntrophales bacterium]|nr:hypothetical protein [Syntrophales bacterium]